MIDILMATYNGEDYIVEQIESILNQSYKKWKLYIRDDGSTDMTTQILDEYEKKYPEKIVIIRDSKKGLGAKLNFAQLLSYSNSDYCMFSDQDDIWLDNKIEVSLKEMHSVECIEGKNKPILIHSDLKVVDERLNIMSESFWKYQNINPNKNEINNILVENIVTGCTMMINRELRNLCLNIPKEAIMHDWWIALVASSLGTIKHLSNCTILYRQHSNNEVGASDVKTLAYIKNKLNKNDIYKSINNSINQATKFYEMYNYKLSDDNKKILNLFSTIKRNGYFKRKKIILKEKLYKNDLRKRIAYILFI